MVTINGVDSTPAAAISVSQSLVIVPQQTLTFTGTYSDAGLAVDGAANYTPTWTWSDNYPSSTELVASRAFSAAGTYTATLTVKDDDGVAGSATITVTVLTPAAALAKMSAYVSGLSGLNAGQKNSLLAKLNAAADAAQRGNTGAACNQLNAFVNEVDADLKSGRMTSVDARTLTNAARQIQTSLGCFRALVEFLNGL
jgi:PKD repeat protein